MSREDRAKWDAKHVAAPVGRPPARLVRWKAHLPRSGRAVDLACGTGGAALWIAQELELAVDAVDCSAVALNSLAEACRRGGILRVTPILADLDSPPFTTDPARYSLVCVASFLDRRRLGWIGSLLQSGGWLFFETFHLGHQQLAPKFRREWMLDRGELSGLFPDLETVEFEEDATRSALLARRTS